MVEHLLKKRMKMTCSEMRFLSENHREAYIGFIMSEIEADEHNLDELYKLVGTMKNKTTEKSLESTIKRLNNGIEKNNKLIDKAVDAKISEIAQDFTHMSSYLPNYEIFKG